MNITKNLQSIFPQGSIGPGSGILQGECGVFAESIIQLPLLGNTIQSKKLAVTQNGGYLAARMFGVNALTEYRVGDVLIIDIGTNEGHVAVVVDVNRVQNSLTLGECNWHLDKRIGYGRIISMQDPTIYGVLRGPFKVDLKLPPLVLNWDAFMQYQTKWDSSIFGQLQDRMSQLTGGKIKLNVFPLYTYESLKNWWYQVYPLDGMEYSVIAPAFIQSNLNPLMFTNANHVSQGCIWSINTQQWQGTAVGSNGQYSELGWDYYGTNPCMGTVVCEEHDMSLFYPDQKAFIDYTIHEIFHGLYHWGRGDGFDFTHNHYWGLNGYPKDMSQCVNDWDLVHLQVNLF